MVYVQKKKNEEKKGYRDLRPSEEEDRDDRELLLLSVESVSSLAELASESELCALTDESVSELLLLSTELVLTLLCFLLLCESNTNPLCNVLVNRLNGGQVNR